MKSYCDTIPIILAAGMGLRLESISLGAPKCLLKVGDNTLIEIQLDLLTECRVTDVIIVTGCNEIAIQSLLGDQFKSIKIHYVSNLLYASTGTAYSLYCSFEKWRQFLKPVLLLHADIVYEKAILHGLLSDTNRVQDTIVLDENFEVLTSDEQVVIGQNDLVRELIKGANLPTAAGESLGMNLWTEEFMEKYFNFLSRFFDADTMNSNWEQSIKPFLDSSPEVNLSFTKTYGMRWININYPADFEIAEEIYKELKNDQRKIK